MEKIFLSIIDFLLTPFTYKFTERVKNDKLINKLVDLYGGSKFTLLRFWDAPFLEVEKIIPKKAKIVDLGCGEGIFTNYIALKSAQRQVLGVEVDKNRLGNADKGIKNVKFVLKDANNFDPPKADVYTMFHLLHHLKTKKDQEELLVKCIKKLDKNDQIIIVEVDKDYSFKYWVSWFTDHVIVAWLFEKKFYEEDIVFRNCREWETLLQKLGLNVKSIKMSDTKPFSHVTLIAQK